MSNSNRCMEQSLSPECWRQYSLKYTCQGNPHSKGIFEPSSEGLREWVKSSRTAFQAGGHQVQRPLDKDRAVWLRNRKLANVTELMS